MVKTIETLVEELGKLTVVEALELSKRLEKEWGVTAIAGAPPVAAEPEKPADAPVTVTLTGFADGKKITVIKKIREYTELGLLEAKKFVEALPNAVKEDIDKEEAEKIKAALEAEGGTVSIK